MVKAVKAPRLERGDVTGSSPVRGTKFCSSCGIDKSIEEFGWKLKRKGIRQHQCRPCYNEWMREYYHAGEKFNHIPRVVERTKQRRKSDLTTLNEWKRQTGCKVCGENCPECLEFHHTDDNKEGNVSALVSNYSLERALKEAAKCVLVCSNCHRKIHSGRIAL